MEITFTAFWEATQLEGKIANPQVTWMAGITSLFIGRQSWEAISNSEGGHYFIGCCEAKPGSHK